MKKNIFIVLVLVLTSIFSFSLISSFRGDISNLVLSYGPGMPLEGILTLKLNNENANIPFSVNFNGIMFDVKKNISLKEFLNNSGVQYSCSPSDCKERYSRGNEDTIKIIPPGVNYLGLVIEKGKDVQIGSLSFDITSEDGTESCGVSPLKINLENDGKINWEYNKPSNNYCEDLKPSLYYSPGDASYGALLTDSPYCEQIKLIKSGRFKLGVDMKNKSSENVTLSIISKEGDTANCQAPPKDGLTSCEVNFTTPKEEKYYICVSSSPESHHEIKAELKSPYCGYGFSASEGFQPFSCNESVADYALFASSSKIKVFNETLKFNEDSFSKFNEEYLTDYLQRYIDAKYDGNCNETCIIPIKIESSQQVTLSNLSFIYSASGIGTVNQKKFYSSSIIPPKIDMNETKIKLSNSGINVPQSYGNYTFYIYLGDYKLKEGRIRVDQVPIIEAVSPKEVPALIPISFSAVVKSLKKNISKYYWDFGDGDSESTDIPFIDHTYEIGMFKLTLRVVDESGLTSTKIFDINAKPPKDYLNKTLKNKRVNINNMNKQITSLPKWYLGLINKEINLNKISSDLSILESDFKNSGADYSMIKSSLDSFVTYTSIKEEDLGSSPVRATININSLRSFGETIPLEREEELAKELKEWNKRVSIKASYKIIYASADISSENNLDIATILDVKINSEYNKSAYFMLTLPEGVSLNDIKSNKSYGFINTSNGIALLLNNLKNKEIKIALPGRDTGLKMFISPKVSELIIPALKCGNGKCESGEDYKNCPSDCQRPLWIPVIWSIFIWLFIGGGIYWIWRYYAKKYDLQIQEKLFRERSDYLKLTSFIAGELNKGKNGKTIRQELEKAGWKNSQVEYAIKKVLKQTLNFQRQIVINFIIKETNSGKIENEIRNELEKAGWNNRLIEYGFHKFKKLKRRMKSK